MWNDVRRLVHWVLLLAIFAEPKLLANEAEASPLTFRTAMQLSSRALDGTVLDYQQRLTRARLACLST